MLLITAILGTVCEAIINHDGQLVSVINLKMKNTLSIVFWGILLSVVSAFSLDIRDQTCPGKSLPISLKQIRLKGNTNINIFNRWGSVPQRRWQCLLQRWAGRGLHVLHRRLLRKWLFLLRRPILLNHKSSRRR